MKKILLTTTILLTSTQSLACNPYALIGNVSHHFGDKHEYNETHETLGIGCEAVKGNTKFEYSVAYTKNSFDADSLYVALGYSKAITDNIYLGGVIGAASGYKDRKKDASDIVPVAGVKVEYEFSDEYSVYTLGLPPFDNMDGVVVAGLKVRF